jgi:hypothetical protein
VAKPLVFELVEAPHTGMPERSDGNQENQCKYQLFNKWQSHWFLNWLKPPTLGCRSEATAIKRIIVNINYLISGKATGF